MYQDGRQNGSRPELWSFPLGVAGRPLGGAPGKDGGATKPAQGRGISGGNGLAGLNSGWPGRPAASLQPGRAAARLQPRPILKTAADCRGGGHLPLYMLQGPLLVRTALRGERCQADAREEKKVEAKKEGGRMYLGCSRGLSYRPRLKCLPLGAHKVADCG